MRFSAGVEGFDVAVCIGLPGAAREVWQLQPEPLAGQAPISLQAWSYAQKLVTA